MANNDNSPINGYELYIHADLLIELLIEKHDGCVHFHQIEEETIKLKLIDLLTINSLVETIIVEESKFLAITHEGIRHHQNGGFRKTLAIKDTTKEELSFSKHLENNSSLIGIFAAFNAIIIFASSTDIVGSYKPGSYIEIGVTLLDLALYIMSIQVLTEIIKNTRQYAHRTEFAAFHLCMYSVEIGIGLIFFEKHRIVFFGSVLLFSITVFLKLITEKGSIIFWLPFNFRIEQGERKIAICLSLLSITVSYLFFFIYRYPELTKHILLTYFKQNK